MPARSVRRRHHKRLQEVLALPKRQRSAEAVRLLSEWRREAFRRAALLDEPLVWDLADSPDIQAMCRHLDRSGELLADLRLICAAAVASVAGRHLVSGSRPAAERARRTKRCT